MKGSVLPNIRVASPCTADWNEMTLLDAEGRARHCKSCDKNVYNLSAMTRAEAEALIVAKEGRLCVGYWQRKDGTILLKDCLVGTANARKRRLVAAGAVALLAGGAALTFTQHTETRSVATTIEQRPVEEVHPDERALPEVAHDDPPPPAPPPEPVAVPIDEWEHTAGIMIMDHDENPI